jgi:hypothetical protein
MLVVRGARQPSPLEESGRCSAVSPLSSRAHSFSTDLRRVPSLVRVFLDQIVSILLSRCFGKTVSEGRRMRNEDRMEEEAWLRNALIADARQVSSSVIALI